MEWLQNMLGFANNAQSGSGGGSPFGALGRFLPGAGSQPQAQPGQQPGQPLNILPQAAGGTADATKPAGGLWGASQPNSAGQNFALNQAMGMLKPQQMQPTQWMPWMQMGGR